MASGPVHVLVLTLVPALAASWTTCVPSTSDRFSSPPIPMPKFVIERELAGAGALSPEQLQGVSQKSCEVLRKLGPQIQWVESYVTDDKIYCVYIAPDEKIIREHAKQGGFPANRVSAVRRVINPTTAEV
jgi:hypothetical protein